MGMYQKKPIQIEARQTGQDYDEDCSILAWCGGHFNGESDLSDRTLFYIDTLEGTMAVSAGDWVIKGVKGEFYPCKPDIFEASYDKVEDK